MRIKLPLSLLLLLFLLSCQDPKTEDPAPGPGAKMFSFNYRFDPEDRGASEFELILSEETGKVVLDTLLAVETDHRLQVKSEETKFDVTTIYDTESDDYRYLIWTYIQVDPDSWQHAKAPAYTSTGETAPAKVRYKNANAVGGIIFTGINALGWSGHSGSQGVEITYDRLLPKDLLYLLIPATGKYIFSEVSSADTVIDFSAAGEAVKRSYDKPQGATTPTVSLIGYPKAGDYGRMLHLYSPLDNLVHGNDLQFPPKGIEEYELRVSYADAEGAAHTYFNLGPEVPQELSLGGTTGFTVAKSATDGFEVVYAQESPVASQLTLKGAIGGERVYWSVYLPFEQTTFKQGPFLKGLQAKILRVGDFSDLQPYILYAYYAEGYTYQSLLDYWHSPEAMQKKELRRYHYVRKNL